MKSSLSSFISSLGFDVSGVWYAVKLSALVAAILGIARVGGNELVNMMSEEHIIEDISYLIRAKRNQKPVYKEMPDNAVIFSSGESALQKQQELVREKNDFFFANLDTMELTYYGQGVAEKSFPIRAKGKNGSFFETPNGLYRVQVKEKNHFSSIGEVWMPWSIHFFGNYFIHGWPYYPDGTPVSDSFSGGCVRLGDAEAKELFELSKRNMPVLIYAGNRHSEPSERYFRKFERGHAQAPPVISAEAVLVADFKSGQILFEKHKDAAHPIASVTKLMTALVSIETLNRFRMIPVSQEALNEEGDSAGLTLGESFRSQDYLYPLLLSSSNDAAKLYEREVWGFVNIMNDKAKAIGLSHTFFRDASGLSSENVSSAEDLFRLLQFIDQHKNPIFTISGVKEFTLASEGKKKIHRWANLNWQRDDPRFLGGKLGITPEAKRAMAGVFKVKFSESDERPVAIIVLRSEDHISDVRAIISYLERNFVYGSTLTREDDGPPGRIDAGAAVYEAFN